MLLIFFNVDGIIITHDVDVVVLLMMLLDQLVIVLVLMLVGAVFPVLFAIPFRHRGPFEYKIQIKL